MKLVASISHPQLSLTIGAAGLSVLLGLGIAVEPQVTLVALVAFLGVAAATAPAAAWVGAALVAALTLKGLASLGALPSVAAFIDIPLAWGALSVALLKGREQSPFARRHLLWLAALGLAAFLAWAFNPSEVLRPLFYVALLGQPFAVVGALLADPPSARMRLLLERLLLGLLLVQIPFAALQLATLGPSDAIQGTLYGAGAGAHVMSAIVTVGAIWVLRGGIGRRTLRAWRLPIVAVLLAIPFVADAKQVILALPAIVLATSWRVGRLALLVRGAVVAASVIALFTLVPAGQTAQKFLEQNQRGQGGKQATALFLWNELADDPASLTFGKGPAETVSRAAFLTTDISQPSGSALEALGLRPAVIAVEADQLALSASSGGTSFNRSTSSALGVFGDLGIFGLLIYAALLGTLFMRIRSVTSAEGVAAAAGFSLFLVLGLAFDWWEQPPFGMFLAVLAGLALTDPRLRARGTADK